jgi:5-methylcytosine-specific restriction endonuclease McrA
MCGKTGGKLHAHHIKEFSKHPELRIDVSNGITYCEECHIEFHKKWEKK